MPRLKAIEPDHATVAVVAWKPFANYFNHVAGTEVDFPAVPDVAAA